MELFKRIRREREMKKFMTGASREAAKDALSALIGMMKKSDKEESLTLKKKAGGEDSEALAINIQYEGSSVTALMYTYMIVKRMADVMGVSFDQTMRMLETIEELWPEVTKEIVEKVETDE